MATSEATVKTNVTRTHAPITQKTPLKTHDASVVFGRRMIIGEAGMTFMPALHQS
jgi:hypothetical protein